MTTFNKMDYIMDIKAKYTRQQHIQLYQVVKVG